MRTSRSSRQSIPPRSRFAGFRFPPEVIVVAVRWSLRFSLSYRDVEELLTERGAEADHVGHLPLGAAVHATAGRCRSPCRHRVGNRWQVDETSMKVAARWRDVDRAVDQFGQVIDVLVSARRDAVAARRFFEQAISATKVTPMEVTTDQAPAYPAILDALLPAAWHRTEQYGNHRVEADHGRLKAAWTDAGPQAGSQRQGGRGACIWSRTFGADTTSWRLRSQRGGEWRSRSTN